MIALNTVAVDRLKKTIHYDMEYQLWIGQCHNTDLSKPGVYDVWAVPTPQVVGWDNWNTNLVRVVSIGVTVI